MTEKNSIVEEAIIQMKNLEELVAENAKGILASTMRQEIKDLVKESLNEADEDEEEIEDDGTEFDSDDIADVTFDDEEEEEDEEEYDEEDYEGMEDDDEEEFEDEEVIDLTNEPMSTVMKVFKKMSPEDQIEVQKDSAGNIHLTDNETDNEYMIMAESELDEYLSDMDEEETIYELEMDDLSDEPLSREKEEEILGDLLDEEFYESDLDEEEYHESVGVDYTDTDEEMEETIYEIEMNEMDDMEEMYNMEEMYDELDEELYEMSDVDEETDETYHMMEAKKAFKAKGKVGHGPKFTYGKTTDYKMPKQKQGTKGVGMGKAKFEYKESPSMKGEFDQKPKTVKKETKEGMMVTPKKEETKEASRTLGSGKYWGKKGLPKPKAAPRHLKVESVDTVEVNLLREKNEEYRKALNVFRNKLNEVAVFNSNLAYATRLFTEHSTSKQEKINILQRFDGVETIKESKNLYKTIKDELSSSKGQQVNESIERTIQKTPSTGSAINLIESKTYENPQFQRMKDLMSKLK